MYRIPRSSLVLPTGPFTGLHNSDPSQIKLSLSPRTRTPRESELWWGALVTAVDVLISKAGFVGHGGCPGIDLCGVLQTGRPPPEQQRSPVKRYRYSSSSSGQAEISDGGGRGEKKVQSTW